MILCLVQDVEFVRGVFDVADEERKRHHTRTCPSSGRCRFAAALGRAAFSTFLTLSFSGEPPMPGARRYLRVTASYDSPERACPHRRTTCTENATLFRGLPLHIRGYLLNEQLPGRLTAVWKGGVRPARRCMELHQGRDL
jgi:hypothetical protein